MSVVSFINSWLKDIVILFILISIAELIMPKGNLKKYIRLVIGLLIIFTVINPFAKLFKLDFNVDKIVFNYTKPETFNSWELEDFYSKQEEQIEKIYINRIMNDLRDLIKSETEYELVDGNISILKNEDKFGEIDHLVLYIREKDIRNNEGSIHIEKIAPIEINHDLGEKFTEDKKGENIKDLISNNYGIEKDRINIKIYKKGIGERNE